jgi:hypothetical protein
MKIIFALLAVMALASCDNKKMPERILVPLPMEIPNPAPVPVPEPVGDIHTKIIVDYDNADGIIHRADFENRQIGSYDKNDFKSDTNAAWVATLNASIVNKDGSLKLKVTSKEYTVKKGISSTRNLDDYSELYFSYEMTIDSDFHFSIGGKLPGLAGRNPAVSQIPDGCKAVGVNDGFSLRSMFREDGRAIGYFYHQDNPLRNGNCGEEIEYTHNGENFKWIVGKTYVVEQFVKMNDAQQANGIVTIHVNGFKVLERTDMTFSESGVHGVNYGFFQFWHGGSSSRWAPHRDSIIYFDNITISEKSLTY